MILSSCRPDQNLCNAILVFRRVSQHSSAGIPPARIAKPTADTAPYSSLSFCDLINVPHFAVCWSTKALN